MINTINAKILTTHSTHKNVQIIDICEDLRTLGLPFEIISKIKSILDINPFEDTVSYTYNPDGIHFYYYPDLYSGGIDFDFEKYNKGH